MISAVEERKDSGDWGAFKKVLFVEMTLALRSSGTYKHCEEHSRQQKQQVQSPWGGDTCGVFSEKEAGLIGALSEG